MDVAVAGVAETRHRQAILLLQPRRKGKEVLQPAPRDDDVLVQLDQSGVAQPVGEFAPQFPQFFAPLPSEGPLDKARRVFPEQFLKAARLHPHRSLLSVQFHHDQRPRAVQPAAARPAPGGVQSELVGHLQRAGKEAALKNRADGLCRGLHGIESRHQQRPEGRQRNEFDGHLCHHSEQALRACHQTCQVEP